MKSIWVSKSLSISIFFFLQVQFLKKSTFLLNIHSIQPSVLQKLLLLFLFFEWAFNIWSIILLPTKNNCIYEGLAGVNDSCPLKYMERQILFLFLNAGFLCLTVTCSFFLSSQDFLFCSIQIFFHLFFISFQLQNYAIH